jgi:hypothetical protein
MRDFHSPWRRWLVGGVALFALGLAQILTQKSNPSLSHTRPAPRAKHAPMIHLFSSDGLPRRGRNNEIISANWSGYALPNGSYVSATATWSVPTVSHAPHPGAATFEDSSTWIGIGGFNDQTLIQLGTEQYVTGTGNHTAYHPWYGLGASATLLPPQYATSPNDEITASLQCTASCSPNVQQTWILSMTNSTKNWTWTGTFKYKSSLASAEWIEEAPTDVFVVVTLADYGLVEFRGISVNGAKANLSLSANGIILSDINWAVSTPCAAFNGNRFVVDYGSSCTHTYEFRGSDGQ